MLSQFKTQLLPSSHIVRWPYIIHALITPSHSSFTFVSQIYFFVFYAKVVNFPTCFCMQEKMMMIMIIIIIIAALVVVKMKEKQ